MDDFNLKSLSTSKNEWASRLINILSPCVVEGYKSILKESIKLCKNNNESEKYLMTFQNLISRIPKWNASIIEEEKNRIVEKSNCNYLEDLVTCIHIIQLKTLTAMRVGNKQKKIDIDIPKIEDFIHKIYINSARKLYQNVYLFEKFIPPLQIQKNNRELEIIINECILNTIRENIPVDNILRVYLDETIEEEIEEDIKEEVIVKALPENIKDEDPIKENLYITKDDEADKNDIDVSRLPKEDVIIPDIDNLDEENQLLSFNDTDFVKDSNDVEHNIVAPKDIDTLEKISEIRNNQRKDDEGDDSDDEKLKISNVEINLDDLDIHSLNEPSIQLKNDDNLDVEILE
jgi:hypothetical protein|uniref:Uncharacterized protein n=1 Tax=viral metagenome TaxID=1070528 RepID=A0A6C0IKX0_9ZZZZ